MVADKNKSEIRISLACRQGFSIFISLIILFLGVQFFCFAQEPADLEAKAREHYRLGQIYYEHGLHAEAEAEFQKALDIMETIPLKPVQKQLTKQIQPDKHPQEVLPDRESTISSGREYIISAGDVIFINVWENPDLTQEVIVRPDGKISFPLIDEVQAQGLTIPQLDKLMTKRLKEFIHYPDVSISLRKMAGERIIVLGEVKSPGIYSLEGRKTVLEVVALAGGFTQHAVLNSVVVIQGGFQKPRARRINLASALRKGRMKEDIALNAQDVVYVPKKFIANLNYFVTQIMGPISQGSPIRTITQW